MIFVCTCSQDATVDILLPYLGDNTIFRFDIDKFECYEWDFTGCHFEISDKRSGKTIDSSSLSSFYLRKPIFIDPIDVPKDGCLENWCRMELDELFHDFYRECESRGQTALVHSRSSKFGKLRQMIVAEKYFPVAPWHMFSGRLPDEARNGAWVMKSLADGRIGEGKVLFVKEINPLSLDLAYPWFIQQKIIGDEEVTVVYVNGQMHACSFPRRKIAASEDVRLATLEDRAKWSPCELDGKEKMAIRSFMEETGYRFGRFDFIRKDGELWFLEMNPNGQWAWLDPDDKGGLITMIADAIKSEDAHHRAQLQK